MGKKKNYSDEILTRAVIEYAEEYKGKIKGTELARWARANVPGLELVEDRDFMFPDRIWNPQKNCYDRVKKPCRKRIDEYNKDRDTIQRIRRNVLLHSTNIDEFRNLDIVNQRELILDTRKEMEELILKNVELDKRNRKLEAANAVLAETDERIEKKLDEIEKKFRKLDHVIRYLTKTLNAEKIEEACRYEGITEHGLDLNRYADAVEEEMRSCFNWNDAKNEFVYNERKEANKGSDAIKNMLGDLFDKKDGNSIE